MQCDLRSKNASPGGCDTLLPWPAVSEVMNGGVRIVGEGGGVFSALPAALHQACLTGLSDGEAFSPRLLVNLAPPAGLAIAAATAFADEAAPAGWDRLIVTIWPKAAATDWAASRTAAELAAFTRHAALVWAPRQVRVNAVAIGADPKSSHSTIVAMILALWRWRSMTGQIINLAD